MGSKTVLSNETLLPVATGLHNIQLSHLHANVNTYPITVRPLHDFTTLHKLFLCFLINVLAPVCGVCTISVCGGIKISIM